VSSAAIELKGDGCESRAVWYESGVDMLASVVRGEVISEVISTTIPWTHRCAVLWSGGQTLYTFDVDLRRCVV